MTETYLFAPPAQPALGLVGETPKFPVRRIFCVGRNYAAHAAEMGNEVDREAPFYFTKSSHAVCPSGSEIAYPAGTRDCHYEMEFVVALGGDLFQAEGTEAMEAVLGYACGIDLTRRDLQGQAKEKRRPWDLGKDFEDAAILGPITRRAAFGEIADQRLKLLMDDREMQSATLDEMVWSVPEILSHLSRFYHLTAGDLIMTGTPAGVGPVHPGARLEGRIDGLEPVQVTIANA